MATTTRRTTTDDVLSALVEQARERAGSSGHHHIRAPFSCQPTDPQASGCRGMHPAVELARACGRTQRQARALLAHKHRWESHGDTYRCPDCGQLKYATGERL